MTTRFVQKQIRINAAPQAGFTFAPTVPNVGDSVLFDAGTTTDDETLANSAFEWDFDNNGSYEAVGKVMPHTFASDGDKTVRLRVTDSLNRTDTVTAVVHVNRPPVANFVYTPSAPTGERDASTSPPSRRTLTTRSSRRPGTSTATASTTTPAEPRPRDPSRPRARTRFACVSPIRAAARPQRRRTWP